ncbi:hypothetical protein ILUMI_09568 [Ignelater luminosus]|uniref:Reverse transcriptase domain-containing protein n=1 Tax=Ignelater luminosus TaxID=2038154 RepID=A0A8K0GFV1_IGNLU|nr:hypothetical protein ILUMI_09568 [Ignelater luminosus]
MDIYGVPTNLTKEEVESALREQNSPDQDKWGEDDLKVLFKFGKRNQPTVHWTAIIIADPNLDVLLHAEQTSPPLVVVTIKLQGVAIKIANIYCPPSQEIEPHLTKLTEVIQHPNILVTEDFNAKVTIWHNEHTDERGAAVLEFLLQNSLLCIYKPDNPPNFKSPNGESNIDLTLTSETVERMIKHWDVRANEVDSDHNLITSPIELRNLKYTTPKASCNLTNIDQAEMTNKTKMLLRDLESMLWEPTTTIRTNDAHTSEHLDFLQAVLDQKFPNDGEEMDTPAHVEIRQNARIAGGNSDLDVEITEEDVLQAISQIKGKKTPGEDGIHGVILKALAPTLADYLRRLYGDCLTLGCYPVAWKMGKLVTILKSPDKDPADAKSLRPITLLSELGKILDRLIRAKITEELGEEHLHQSQQYGFRKSRSTTQAIQQLLNLITTNEHKYVVALAIDISGAFDNLWWPVTILRASAMGLPEKLVQIRNDLNGRQITYETANETASKMLIVDQSLRCPRVISIHDIPNVSNQWWNLTPGRDIEQVQCPACRRGDAPEGVHKCVVCNKNVHVLDTCSALIAGKKEGSGEKRLCRECSTIDEQAIDEIVATNQQENWRGLVEPVQEEEPPKKRAKYVKGTLQRNDLDTRKKSKHSPTLRNENVLDLQPVHLENKYYTAVNTSGTSLWPILGLLKHNVVRKPFPITLFCGNSKPSLLSTFLEDFIGELKGLLKDGFK